MNQDTLLEAASLVLQGGAEARQVLEGTTTHGEKSEVSFSPEDAAEMLDGMTAEAFMQNHVNKQKLDFAKRQSVRSTEFLVRIATPGKLKKNGHSATENVVYEVPVADAIKRTVGDDAPKSAFVSSIEVISASQNNNEGRTMYLRFGDGGDCHDI